MYNQNHLRIPAKFTNARLPNVAFYGDKVVATDSFRLIEMKAGGKPHEPVQYPAQLVKNIKINKNATINHEEMGIVPDEESHFPDYQELQKKFDKEECIEFAVDGKMLGELATALSKLSKKQTIYIKVPKSYENGTKGNPTPITLTAPDTFAWLMPANPN